MVVKPAGEGGGGTSGPIDWGVVRSAALVAIAITVPVGVAVRVLRGDADGGRSALWVIAVVALFAGFALAGNYAARRRPDAPLLHAATSAAVAFAVLGVATIARRVAGGDGVSAALVITLGLLLQISVSLALLGAYIGIRHRAGIERGAGE